MKRMPDHKNILVIRPEKLGDLVVATPVFRALRHSFPSAHITLLSDRIYADIIRDDPNVDEVLPIDWTLRARGMHEPILSVSKKLRPFNFDLALILYANWSGWNLAAAFSRIRRVVQVGGTWAGALLNHKIVRRHAFDRQLHYRDYYLEAAGACGAVLPQDDDRNPRVYLDEVTRDSFLHRYPRSAEVKRVILHPFGRGSSPNYSRASYAQLARVLGDEIGVEVWVTGGPGDLPDWPAMSHKKVKCDWLGTLTVREMMGACASVDAVICGSTGVIHLAAALGTPTVGLFCPHPGSHPRAWGPLGSRSINLVVPKRKCRKLVSSTSACAADNSCDLICGIPIESVLCAVQDILK